MGWEDPNEWNERYVKRNSKACFQTLHTCNSLSIKYLSEGNCKAAVAGIDRILNGLITMQNAGIPGIRPFLCFFSMCNGLIITCGIDAPESKKRAVAIANFEDAHDFATGDTMKNMAKTAISLLKSRKSMDEIIDELDVSPQDLIQELEDLNERLAAAG